MGADDDVDLAFGDLLARLLASLAVTRRERRPISIGKPLKRSQKLVKCWRARRVVGRDHATCIPAMAATNAARKATSVLPKPTSPQTSRSIGLPAPRSLDHVGNRPVLILGLS
jgi:hypothetical protein